jgi:hypothetical protein
MTHNIIKAENYKTENYLLVVDDSEIKQNDFFYGVADGSIKPFIEIADENTVKIVTWQLNVTGKSPNKKIAAHLPLNNSPVLEGVPLLPPLEDGVERLVKEHWEKDKELNNPSSFKSGYKKAKEKYKYTEEDLRKCWKACLDFNKPAGGDSGINLEDFIQSLQQPKMPFGFECEIFEAKDLKSVDGDWMKLGKPKTTTNPQGQTVLAGKYIY